MKNNEDKSESQIDRQAMAYISRISDGIDA